MIAVAADDLTGAAELAGVGHRFGLRTVMIMDEAFTDAAVDRSADLLVIATNTRSSDEAEAVSVMKEVTRKLMALDAEWIYKKTDSVLRGHVIAELRGMLGVLGLQRVLLVPANPLLGRVINNGIYYYNGRPIHESAFGSDPDFPIRCSVVRDMLRGDLDGLTVGEVSEMSDLEHWATIADDTMLCAGAAGFFEALLRLRFGRAPVEAAPASFGSAMLVVSGTAFDAGRAYHKDIVKIGEGGMSALVEKVCRQMDGVQELFIEGGATAFAVLTALGFSGFVPEEELAPGVVRMKVPGRPSLYVTVKPGSYAWGERIRRLLDN